MPAPLLAMLALLAAGPAEVTVEPLPFDPARLASMAQAEVKATERGGEVTYSGVPLAALLDAPQGEKGSMRSLRALSDAVVLVRARDNYQAAVSAASVAMDAKGARYLLATHRNGQALADDQGPVKLIVPGDPEHVRWVRMVSAVELVRLPRPASAKAKAERAPAPSPPARP